MALGSARARSPSSGDKTKPGEQVGSRQHQLEPGVVRGEAPKGHAAGPLSRRGLNAFSTRAGRRVRQVEVEIVARWRPARVMLAELSERHVDNGELGRACRVVLPFPARCMPGPG